MRKVFNQIKCPIFFVTPDINWALGLEDYLSDYHIVCLDWHPVIDLLPEKVKVFCLRKEFSRLAGGLKCPKNTGVMLSLPEVQEYIARESRGEQPVVMFFKPSAMIDKVCREKGYLQIGNSASLNRKWEDKLRLVELGERYPELQLVPGKVMKLDKINLNKLFLDNQGDPHHLPLRKRESDSFVIQTARGWAGKSTFLVSSDEEFEDLKKRLGDIQVKLSTFILGKTYLNNACVADGGVLQSLPALQINCPDKDFSSLPLATCGRQWGNLDLSIEQIDQMKKITEKVGTLMAEDGYRGYFGLDFMVEDETGKVFLQEINPRLTASSSFYAKLEIGAGEVPLLFWHLVSFLDGSVEHSVTPLLIKRGQGGVNGLQLILRNSNSKFVKIKNELKLGIYKFRGDNFEFIRSSYSAIDVEFEDEFLLVSPAKGTEVSSESELLRCESGFAVLENGEVPAGLKSALVKLKKSLV